jgi:hypothetical protein
MARVCEKLATIDEGADCESRFSPSSYSHRFGFQKKILLEALERGYKPESMSSIGKASTEANGPDAETASTDFGFLIVAVVQSSDRRDSSYCEDKVSGDAACSFTTVELEQIKWFQEVVRGMS